MMDAAGSDGPFICRTATIVNRRGLHARAAAKFVRLVEGYEAQVQVSRNGMTVGGDSIMGLMMLAASPGTEIDLRAWGPDAASLVDAITDLIDRRFDED